MEKPVKVLFVCLGNIVRSPLGENVFMHLVEEQGLQNKYKADSAGTIGYHAGETPDSRMRRVASKRGLQYTGKARQVQDRDFVDFDLIIAMDTTNREDLLERAGTDTHRSKIHLMREFDPHVNTEASVPDPYYGGIDGFEEVYDIVDRSCRVLLEKLEAGELVE
ncbi:MAG: low molecular weight phosphotyrosine protein phosphatase [Anaerolineales bacterium]|nr:low molecular weight phosphotyrosine protein phosphatase [Anaerolineales bacterium]